MVVMMYFNVFVYGYYSDLGLFRKRNSIDKKCDI